MTETEAFDAMLQHHQILVENVDSHIAALANDVRKESAYGPAVASLVAYLADEVLPHAMAEEQSIYRIARTRPNLTDAVDLMIAEHRDLAAQIESLARATTANSALNDAQHIGALFKAHVAKENTELLPSLLEDFDVDVVQLLTDMHRLTEEKPSVASDENAPTSDAEAAVLSLLLEAAKELARTGNGDRACRLVAQAWAALRSSRPDLAAKTTASLHGLARLVSSEPVSARSRAVLDEKRSDRELDVRHLAPTQRHETILASYLDLAPGAAYVLVNDHDPKPLRYQFEAEYTGQFTWDYLESGPEVWRVRIEKVSPHDAPGEAPEDSTVEVVDIRVVPHNQRHEVIFAIYDRLAPRTGFELVNDHDPRPLRYQFEAQHADVFTWDYLESGPEVWRVRIGKRATKSIS
ncbi:MAG: DUF2249 domain-containing protein [Acidimicrobiales bacterium]